MGKIKQHLIDYKKEYMIAASITIAGVVGYSIGSKRPGVSNTIMQVLSYKPNATLEVHIEALGDPGNIVQDLTTQTIYASQGQAARALGVSPAYMSQHLSGKRAHVNGHIFTKLGKAIVSDV